MKLTETESLYVWSAKHQVCGRGAGPWYDTKIGDYHTWRCACGGRWQCTEDELDRAPAWCALTVGK